MYPVMPTTNLQDSQSDRAVLSRPSLVLVTWLLDSSLDNVTKVIMIRIISFIVIFLYHAGTNSTNLAMILSDSV